MITLYQFPPVWGLPNSSPFCLKIETYLRMAEIPYENRFVMDPRKSPKGKLPIIKIDTTAIADSEIIIDYLIEKYGDFLDKKLDIKQKAVSALLDYTFSERLYWQILYFRWKEDKGWKHVQEAFFAKLPMLTKLFVPAMARKNMVRNLHAQGTGRHSRTEILLMVGKTLDAIAAILGTEKYFQGNELSSIDATAFGFLANIAWQPYEDDLKIKLYEHKNLLAFCDKMWNLFYPEIPKPFVLDY